MGLKPGQGTRSHMLQRTPGDVCMLLCLTLCDPIDCTPTRPLCPWDSSGKLYWSGLLYPPPGDLPNPGIKSHMSPALTGKFFTTSVTWEDPEQTDNSNNTFKNKDASISGLPGDPVVKTPCFHCRGCRFHGSGWGHKKKKKERKDASI